MAQQDASTDVQNSRGQNLRSALRIGVVLGFVSLAVSTLTLGALGLFLPKEEWGPSAAAGIGDLSTAGIAFIAVLYAPIVETVLVQVLPIEILRRLRGTRLVCVLVSAGLFGGGHYLNGGVAHGATTFSAGLVFAYGYTLSRGHGFWPAFVTTAVAHAVHNFLALFVLVHLLPESL